MGRKPVTSRFGTVGRCQVVLEKEISISVKLVSRRKHEVLLNLLVDGYIDSGLDKTQWTNTSRWHGTPNHHWLWKLHTGLQATWILCLSTLPPDSGTLISKWNAKFPLSNCSVLFLLCSGKMLLTLSLVQEWLDTRNASLVAHFLDTSVRGGSWCTDSSLSPLLVKLPLSSWIGFAWQSSKAAVIPVACAPFPTTPFPSNQLSMNMLWYSTLWTTSHFSNDFMWLTRPRHWRLRKPLQVFWVN